MPVVQDILVVGGGSRIATALVPLLGAQARYAVRRSTGRPHEIVVSDYGALPDAALEGIRCVVNCAGISTGDAAQLHAINADLPRRLGEASKAAGVGHLIHISSFSVYGSARTIDCSTSAAPTSDYGRSKQAGDAALCALADNCFSVTLLRLPLIYGKDVAGKLAQLLRLWTRVKVLPVPARDVRRAMIGVDLAAEIVARLALTRGAACANVVLAADPRPFSYADAAQARGGRLHRLPLPTLATNLAERIAPTISARLFASSRLVPENNVAVGYGLPSRLYADIAAADL